VQHTALFQGPHDQRLAASGRAEHASAQAPRYRRPSMTAICRFALCAEHLAFVGLDMGLWMKRLGIRLSRQQGKATVDQVAVRQGYCNAKTLLGGARSFNIARSCLKQSIPSADCGSGEDTLLSFPQVNNRQRSNWAADLRCLAGRLGGC